MKEVWLERAKQLLQHDATQQPETIVFSDEKLFDVEQCFNSQNNRVWLTLEAASTSTDRRVLRSQKPASVMVWAAACATGKTPLHFVDSGESKLTKCTTGNAFYVTNCSLGRISTSLNQTGPFNKTQRHRTEPKRRKNGVRRICQVLSRRHWLPYSPNLNPLEYP
jgi:hypothetical protein